MDNDRGVDNDNTFNSNILATVSNESLLLELEKRFISYIMVYNVMPLQGDCPVTDTAFAGQLVELLGLLHFGQLEINELIKSSSGIGNSAGTEPPAGS